jgi:enterobacterial common antigen flippase
MSSDHPSHAAVTPLNQDIPQPKQETKIENHSYGQILKSSALIGGSQVASIAIRIIRTKAMAMLLGPAGVGLMGVYESITNLVQSVAGVGINSSGVRQIAEAVGSGHKERIAQTVIVLKRTSFLLGILGAILLILFSKQVSILTFGNDRHTSAVALLSFVVCFGLISGGQGALIQGMRRISDLARMGVLGTLFGTIISIPVIYFMGEGGVVPSLMAISGMGIVISWWYSRKVEIEPVELKVSQMRQEVASLLRLGFAFMSSAILMMGAAWAVRIMLLRMVGIEAAGLYQAAWALGGLYVGLILQAMSADFYPRLTAVAINNAECNRLVNEQAQISLLLAGPGVLATLTFAPVVIFMFYTRRFEGAIEILRWVCLGMTLRVMTWPMGFIILAKGESKFFFLTEMAWTLVNVGLSWICIRAFGLSGAGMAFFGSYVFHGFLVYPVVRYLSGFRWSTANKHTALLFLSLISLVFCSLILLPFWFATSMGVIAMLLSSVYSIQTLLNLVSTDRIPRPILRLIGRLGFVSVGLK